MGLRYVIYEDWRMECCGTPFGVGDEVSWPPLTALPESLSTAAVPAGRPT
ncbi:DUF6578 domain-containing protein [Streptomyces djakartensis]|uniref:Uncharacterized protein n=1 Tax=Streptomyces djakartensis TaxID=68193 RepID=A0ABQ3ABX4_9ACTN|nr:DUF6578 domain-containing protein [Streptomyces djakartensis]GGY40323.1 hypothetical protein GCM10010384_54180 [Streptomyces djakartensis]